LTAFDIGYRKASHGINSQTFLEGNRRNSADRNNNYISVYRQAVVPSDKGTGRVDSLQILTGKTTYISQQQKLHFNPNHTAIIHPLIISVQFRCANSNNFALLQHELP